MTAASSAGHAPADEAAFTAGVATVKILTTNDCVTEYNATGNRVTSVCAGAPLSGGDTYANTGSDTGRLTIAWDFGDWCVYNLMYTSTTMGRIAYTCRLSEGATVDFVAVPRTASGQAPTVQFVAFQSGRGPATGGDTYGRGETIWVVVGFDRVVGVTGTPQIGLHIGGRTRPAAYVSGAGTEVLSFRYVVQAADRDADGIHIPANALTWNGGSIRAGGVDAVRTHAAVAVDPGRKVDGGVSASMTLRPARLDVPERRTGRYSVVLDMEPAGAVTVLIASDHDEVVPTPGALTFTTTTWATAQTATVAAAEDNDAQDDVATLGHTVGGFGAGNVRAAALRVTVEDDDAGDRRQPNPDGHRRGRGAAGVRITKPETLAADVTVTVSPPAADQPVTAALLLLHYDGSRWTMVAEPRDLGTRVCAPGVTDFSPFVLGYVRRAVVPVNSTPRFPDDAAVDLPIYTQGTAIAPVTLPGATGGVGALTYMLTGPDGADLPLGLSYTHPTAEDAHGGTLSGTPTEAQEPTSYTLTATDRNGDSVDLEFSLEVTADVMPMFRDDAAVADHDYVIGVAIPPLRFPPAEAGNAPLMYTLVGPEGADLPAGLHYTPPEAEDAHGGVLRGTPRDVADMGRYTLTATDADGDSAELSFRLAVAADSVPTFGERTMTDRQYPVGSPIPVVTFPPAKEGNGC